MDLKPEKFFKFFEEISEIPRGSGNEKGISDYLVKFAKDRNLEAIQDKALNVIIKKPGTPGYENSPTVILQGHMDMVCEKNKDVEHDFTKDPLKLYVENGELKARGTTLGADNGVAVAAALAILDSNDLKHPPLEALMTTGEEIGLLGAAAVDPGNLDGRLLLNLDSGGEGEFLTACAGGLRADIYLPVTRVDAPSGFEFYVLEVKGLHGGHSGEDIILGRANANVLLSRLLYEIGAAGFYYHLASISGGQKDNAIPREAEAVIAVSDYEGVKDFIEKRRLVVASEYSGIEENIVFRLTKTRPSKVFDYDSLRTVIDLINVSPNGIFKMSAKIEGLVETSNNIAIVSTSENETVVSVSLRSSVASRLEELYNKFEILAERLGGKIQRRAEYPGWEYKSESKLRDVCVAAYEQTSGKETKKKAKVKAIHAGVECGILSDKIPGLDAISFGPIMRDFHTPEEALDIASCGRFYNLTINILERLK